MPFPITHIYTLVLHSILLGKKETTLLKTKLNINIKTKFIYCVQHIVK